MNTDRTPPEQIPIEDLLPHRAPMLLLTGLLSASPTQLRASATVPESGLFELPLQPGCVSAAAFGLECMAQAIAAWDGYFCCVTQQPIRTGLILGARDFHSAHATFAAGTYLQISADLVMQTDEGIGVFDCTINAGAVMQTARLTVLTVSDLEEVRNLAR
ncbi:MAG: 3-hydroxylacyl-ACP dehydratase [Proteobacteria bacterium]|nr:3-hydroxylacyl-ACP dehydratase [Pseudomonadota bacterium]